MAGKDVSWILMRVEERDVIHWDAGGDWFTPGRWDYIKEGYDMLDVFEEDSRLSSFLETGPDVWMVLFVGVSWVDDPGGWDLNYGLASPGHYVEYETCAIVEHDFDPCSKIMGREN